MDMKAIADEAIKDLREFIETETQVVKAEHDLEAKLQAVSNVFGHIQESVPLNMEEFHDLNNTIMQGILAIMEFLEQNELADIQFKREEEKILRKLSDDVRHREWQFVRTDINQGKEGEVNILRVDGAHIKKLHELFSALMKEMKKSKLIQSLHSGDFKTKEDYAVTELHYFDEIYKFLGAYERILRDLWHKERKLIK